MLIPPSRRRNESVARVRAALRDHLVMTALTAAVTALVVIVFLAFAPWPRTAVAGMFALTVPSYHVVGVTLAAVLMLPLALVPGGRLAVVAASFLWLMLLASDLVVFRAMRLHIDAAVLDMILFDFASIGVPAAMMAAIAAGACAVFALAVVLWRISRGASERAARRAARFLGLLALLFLLNTTIGIWAFRHDRDEITVIASYLPAYLPITSHRTGDQLSRLLPGLFPAGGTEFAGQGSSAYPLEPLSCPDGPRPSVLVIFLESLQADLLSPEVMPHLDRFAADALRFDRHLANGSSTVPSLFAFFFGVHPSYYPSFRNTARRNPAILTSALAANGYDIRVFTSSSLERFALRRLMFPMVDDAHYVFDRSDDVVRAALIDSLRGDGTARPRFDFLFLTSTHHPYRYPPDFERFRPVPAIEGGFILDRHVDPEPYRNDYRNSAGFVDAQVSEVIEVLSATGRLDETVVIVTSDHAEEFNESGLGYWGHGSRFHRWQTHVPFVLRLPGGAPAGRVEKASAHVDVVPTILGDVLGCTTPRESYSNGHSLLALPDRRGVVMSSYTMNAHWLDGMVLERGTGQSYAWDERAPPPTGIDRHLQRTLLVEEARFRQP